MNLVYQSYFEYHHHLLRKLNINLAFSFYINFKKVKENTYTVIRSPQQNKAAQIIIMKIIVGTLTSLLFLIKTSSSSVPQEIPSSTSSLRRPLWCPEDRCDRMGHYPPGTKVFWNGCLSKWRCKRHCFAVKPGDERKYSLFSGSKSRYAKQIQREPILICETGKVRLTTEKLPPPPTTTTEATTTTTTSKTTSITNKWLLPEIIIEPLPFPPQSVHTDLSFFGKKPPPVIRIDRSYINCQQVTVEFPKYIASILPLFVKESCGMFEVSCKIFKKSVESLTNWINWMSNDLKNQCARNDLENILDLKSSVSDPISDDEVSGSGSGSVEEDTVSENLQNFFELIRFTKVIFEEVNRASAKDVAFCEFKKDCKFTTEAVLIKAYKSGLGNLQDSSANYVVNKAFGLAPDFVKVGVKNICSYGDDELNCDGLFYSDVSQRLNWQSKVINKEIKPHLQFLEKIVEVWDKNNIMMVEVIELYQ